MVNSIIKELYGGKVIGMFKKYILTSVPGNDAFTFEPSEGFEYIIYILKDNWMYSVNLEDDNDWCGSGYCVASLGLMHVNKLYRINDNEFRSPGPLTHIPFDKNLTIEPRDESIDTFAYSNDFEGCNVFYCDPDGGDEYYPCGNVYVNESLFKELPRAMKYRPRYIFIGESGLGKSTLGSYLNGLLTVYETDRSDKLPNVIWEDIVVLGNKYPFTKEEVKAHLSSNDNVIIVKFSKENKMVIHKTSRDMQRDKDICKLWNFTEMTMEEIGERYGVGRERIRVILKRNGYTGAQRKRLFYEDICDDYKGGMNTRELSNKYSVRIETVRNILKRYGLWKTK